MKQPKRINIILALFLLASSLGWAQRGDVVLAEGFYNAWLNEDWDVTGDPWAVWYISNTTFAGGKTHELQMYPDYNFNGTTMLTSPLVNLNDYDYIMIQFNHCIETFNNPNIGLIGIGISSDNESWRSIWTDTITGNLDQCQYLLTFDMEPWDTKSNYFCFYYAGDGSCVKNWFLDNIIIYADKKDKYGRMGEEADDNGFVAAKSRIGNGKAKNVFTKQKRSKNKFSKIVNGNRL